MGKVYKKEIEELEHKMAICALHLPLSSIKNTGYMLIIINREASLVDPTNLHVNFSNACSVNKISSLERLVGMYSGKFVDS